MDKLSAGGSFLFLQMDKGKLSEKKDALRLLVFFWGEGLAFVSQTNEKYYYKGGEGYLAQSSVNQRFRHSGCAYR